MTDKEILEIAKAFRRFKSHNDDIDEKASFIISCCEHYFAGFFSKSGKIEEFLKECGNK